MIETKEKIIRLKEIVDGIPVDEKEAGISNKVNGLSSRLRKSASKTKDTEKPKSDPYIWGIYIFMLVISIVELFSASSFEVTLTNVYAPLIRHAIFLALGFGIIVWFHKLPYITFRRWSRVAALVSFILLLLVTFGFGVSINGADRALRYAGITIQPAEIAKIAIVVVLAQILATNQIPRGVSNKGIILAAVVVMLFGALTWKNGLTNTLLVMGISCCMFLIGGMKMSKFFLVIAIYGTFGAVLYLAKPSHSDNDFTSEVQTSAQTIQTVSSEDQSIGRSETHKNRLARFFKGVKPSDPTDDLNRQVKMSYYAQAHGGLIGKGPGNSRESARLPLAFSDYIYSIVVEDTGFVGGVILLALYLCLIGRAGFIAGRCSRAFPALLVMGSALLIVLQALIHMAIVVGIVPVSGQPLPFISKGGTSVLVMSAAIGMMLSVSRHGMTGGNKKKMRAELKELPSDMHAENPTMISE
ncbi:MAG: FtsW/RodA/SpoVE family cell cycle protein [Prevotella sp.]|nr:FtsW/RodA/SpoVE family cell cycle protein [Bacteroides sp.]MCM1366247.1 FtsW/RodA/SpoVE family cell cycle protein [Prevotella sp.]MCM1436348.1 FtsW/RodA/SpoVE family cell cycle protein [Prevotella sp.]